MPEGRWLAFVLSHPFRTERGMNGAPSLVAGVENAKEEWATRRIREIQHLVTRM